MVRATSLAPNRPNVCVANAWLPSYAYATRLRNMKMLWNHYEIGTRASLRANGVSKWASIPLG